MRHTVPQQEHRKNTAAGYPLARPGSPDNMPTPAYKRVLLKLSGEALMGDDPYGINRATIERMVADVSEVAAQVAAAQKG